MLSSFVVSKKETPHERASLACSGSKDSPLSWLFQHHAVECNQLILYPFSRIRDKAVRLNNCSLSNNPRLLSNNLLDAGRFRTVQHSEKIHPHRQRRHWQAVSTHPGNKPLADNNLTICTYNLKKGRFPWQET